MKKGLIQLFAANAIFLIFGVVNNFILPKYLSMDSYSMLKTYMFYMSYSAVFTGGYIEGMYLKYGGQTVTTSKKQHFGDNVITYTVLQGGITAVIFLYGLIFRQQMMILFSLSLLITNIGNYLKNYCTAVGEFKIYSIALSFEKIALFVLNLFLLFICKAESYIPYAAIIIAILFFETLYIFYKIFQVDAEVFKGKLKLSEFVGSVKSGIVLMIGNFASTLFTGLDRWFVKFCMTNVDFAVYSFAVSIEQVVNAFIAPVSTTLYNYFCRGVKEEQIRQIKRMVLLWAFAIMVIAFPARFVIERYITQYVKAVDLVFLLLAGQAITCMTNSIYVNLYKALKRQKEFLNQIIIMTICAGVLNAVGFALTKSMIIIAAATLLTKLIWLLWCEKKFAAYRYSCRDYMAILILLLAFIGSGMVNNVYLGMLSYIIIYLAVGFIFMRDTLFQIIGIGKSMLFQYIRK